MNRGVQSHRAQYALKLAKITQYALKYSKIRQYALKLAKIRQYALKLAKIRQYTKYSLLHKEDVRAPRCGLAQHPHKK